MIHSPLGLHSSLEERGFMMTGNEFFLTCDETIILIRKQLKVINWCYVFLLQLQALSFNEYLIIQL